MRKFSRNKQKDKQPLAGLFALKQLLIVPLCVFALILSGVNLVVPSTI